MPIGSRVTCLSRRVWCHGDGPSSVTGVRARDGWVEREPTEEQIEAALDVDCTESLIRTRIVR